MSSWSSTSSPRGSGGKVGGCLQRIRLPAVVLVVVLLLALGLFAAEDEMVLRPERRFNNVAATTDAAAAAAAAASEAASARQPCGDFECCHARGFSVFAQFYPEECYDPTAGRVFTACRPAPHDWGCVAAPSGGGDDSSSGGSDSDTDEALGVFKHHLRQMRGNATQRLESFRQEQLAALAAFVHDEGRREREIVEELTIAAAALQKAAAFSIGAPQQQQLPQQQQQQQQSYAYDYSKADASEAAQRGQDTWVFMIPIVRSNARRQQRLVANICSLSWPPLSLVGVVLLVDAASRSLVEATVPSLEGCGVGRVALHDDPPQKYVQPVGAVERHSLDAQFERRAAIAEARNYLLRLALMPRHTSVVWVDSDLYSFPRDVLRLLQRSGK
jgi:hypothetical protein